MAADVKHFKDCGADDVLRKPLNTDELKKILKYHISSNPEWNARKAILLAN
jgi:DNA-binding response OmpR family regulator